MTISDLRPLSLGEILDRTLSLYRQHFVLFVGIAALPQLLNLALSLAQVWTGRVAGGHKQVAVAVAAAGFIGGLVGVVVYLVVYLFAQGGTVYAVSEIYLGRPATIGASLKRMRGQVGNLFGVTLLNGLVIGIATILLIVPGIYMACRLITCVPAALLEDLGPRDSLERSYRLTEDSAGRSFVIYLLYFFLLYAAVLLFILPFSVASRLTANDPGSVWVWLVLGQVGNFLATTLVTPILTIATAVFYYDLRVRKEAFDLQLLMNQVGRTARPSAGVGTTLY
ncbi:MAG TPA: hypothetical protein VN846_07970 [Candidatus Cybelea sp.]|nr:hypothetical protein [Candidatus Cybelea sp.]